MDGTGFKLLYSRPWIRDVFCPAPEGAAIDAIDARCCHRCQVLPSMPSMPSMQSHNSKNRETPKPSDGMMRGLLAFWFLRVVLGVKCRALLFGRSFRLRALRGLLFKRCCLLLLPPGEQ